MFASATSIFSAGSAFRWVRDQLCLDLAGDAGAGVSRDAYNRMTALAATSPLGANRLLFNPSLAGGNALDPSPRIRGAFSGLDLRHTRADLIRAAMEGITLGLRLALDALRREAALSDDMLLVGGGSRSPLWRQIFADAFNTNILTTNVGQQAASLGAMAIGAVGCGLWPDFARVDQVHQQPDVTRPIAENVAQYEAILPVFRRLRACQAEIADLWE